MLRKTLLLMIKPTVLHTSSFTPDAARLIETEAARAIAERGLFRLGLCGGGTPRPVYAALAKAELPWGKIQITFGDERAVPPDDAQSNYRMAREAWLGHVPLPEGNVFRMRGELPAAEAAEEYQARLSAVAARFGEPRYAHDLLLLGMGDDGHTASLFPDTAALAETERDVVANHVPKLGVERITLTFPCINASRKIVFLVNDPKKQPVVDAVLSGQSAYPSGRVAPASGELVWLLGDGQ